MNNGEKSPIKKTRKKDAQKVQKLLYWCSSEEEAMKLLENEGNKLDVFFVSNKTEEFDLKKLHISWHSDGYPYVVLHSNTFASFTKSGDCMGRSISSHTTAIVGRIAAFTQYKKYMGHKNTSYFRSKLGATLKKWLVSGEEIKTRIQFYVEFTFHTSKLKHQQIQPNEEKANKDVWTSSYKSALKLVKDFQTETSTKFIRWQRHSYKIKSQKNPVKWDRESGMPYIVLRSITKECEFGKFRSCHRKPKATGKRKSKKVGCPAWLSLMECVKFPQYKVPVFEPSTVFKLERSLRSALSSSYSRLRKKTCWLVKLPLNSYHRGHVVEKNSSLVQSEDDSESSETPDNTDWSSESGNFVADEVVRENHDENSSANQEEMNNIIDLITSLTSDIHTVALNIKSIEGLRGIVEDLEFVHNKAIQFCDDDSESFSSISPVKRKVSRHDSDELPTKFRKSNSNKSVDEINVYKTKLDISQSDQTENEMVTGKPSLDISQFDDDFSVIDLTTPSSEPIVVVCLGSEEEFNEQMEEPILSITPVKEKLHLEIEEPTENTSLLDDTTKMFTPCLALLPPVDLNKPAIQNGSHSLSLIQLKCLEPKLPKEELMILKKHNKAFKEAWLFDEVINSYLWRLCQNHPSCIYASSIVSQILIKKGSIKKLWSDEQLHGKSTLFMPWNPSGFHWILLAVDIKQQKLLYLDPTEQPCPLTNIFVKNAKVFMNRLLWEKFQTKLVSVETPPRTMQSDSSNCGVFVCHYAKLIASEQSLCSPNVSIRTLRKEIYDDIVGNCSLWSDKGSFD